MLACPQCRRVLTPPEACACGFVPERRRGVLQLMSPEALARYEAFCEAYEGVRAAEGWGGDDLDLPFEPKRHQEVWSVRAHSFKRLDRLVQKECRQGGRALDVGAGNCWLTSHLDHWGFEATALDVSDGIQDGLAAGAPYLECGDSFERVRAPMEDLPFVDDVFDLIVANGSLHYAPDLGQTLKEFHRVLRRGGLIVVMDSPWYERKRDGMRAWEQSVQDLVSRHGLAEDMARRSSFLYRTSLVAITMQHNLSFQTVSVWPGPRRALESLKARFYERRIAAFPLLLIRSTQ